MSNFLRFKTKWPVGLEVRLQLADSDYRDQCMNKSNLSREENERNKQAYQKLVQDARDQVYGTIAALVLVLIVAIAGKYVLAVLINKIYPCESCSRGEILKLGLQDLQLFIIVRIGFTTVTAI